MTTKTDAAHGTGNAATMMTIRVMTKAQRGRRFCVVAADFNCQEFSMPGGSITLANVAARTDTLSIACTQCDRAGKYPVATLLKRFGPEIPIPDLLRVLSQGCPMREAADPAALCGMYYHDLPPR